MGEGRSPNSDQATAEELRCFPRNKATFGRVSVVSVFG